MHINLANSRVPRCQHIKADGVQCNNPAMKTVRFCYYHMQIERSTRAPHKPAPILAFDSFDAIIISITDIANRVARGAMDHREARILLRSVHSATIVLKQKAAMPDNKEPVRPITDLNALEPHVVVLTPEDCRRAQSGRSMLDLAQTLARADREREAREAKLTPLTFDAPAIGPSPYTMLPSEYEDDESSPTSEIDSLPPEKREQEIERRHNEITNSIPPSTRNGEPLRCELLDEPTCHYTKLDPRVFTCPIDKARNAFNHYVLPDLHPHLKDDKTCGLLHFIALNQDECGYGLDAGPRDGLSRPYWLLKQRGWKVPHCDWPGYEPPPDESEDESDDDSDDASDYPAANHAQQACSGVQSIVPDLTLSRTTTDEQGLP